MSNNDTTSTQAASASTVAPSVAGGAAVPVRESFASRFIKRNGYLYCTRCYVKVLPTDHPHDCRDGRAWAAR